ncbi:hypothetical protein NQZ79_g184 [Umbelopsis isabellina]|nr:hypothetical protein NQZ79_g184 [Umbelopsis isabellina]
MSRDSCNEPSSSQSSVKETSHESTPSTTPITFSPSEPNVPPPSPMTKVSTPNEGERLPAGGGLARGPASESKKKLLSSESFEEAMLEAPYQEKPQVEESASQTSNGHSDSRYKEDERRSSSRHSASSRPRSSSRSYRDDYRSDRHRSRSRHSSRRHRSRSRDYRQSDSRERDYYSSRRPDSRSRRRRSRSPRRRSRSRERHDRRRRNRSASPPIPEEERDKRTVFVTQLSVRLENRELEEFFSQAGKVRDAKIILDRNSRRSKGVGYVEFYEEASVQNALAMSGQKLLGIPVQVQVTEAEKNRLAMQAQNAAYGQDISYHRLYVGSIHFKLTEDELRQIFEPFGPIDSINLHTDETGRSRGFAFIQFRNGMDAKQALDKMNGYELAGRNLRVGLVNEKTGTAGNYSLDEEETSGISLNSTSRAELMQKLAARQSDLSPQAPVQKPAPPPPKVNVPTAAATRTIMLNNMFNPAEETEPNWVQELEADIKDECSQYGQILHVNVNDDSLGEVFLKFENVQSGERAVKALNGRWFGGKQAST